MGITVVKANTYRLIDANSFELPLPFRFSVFKKDYHIADYEITEDEQIICNIITKFKEDMITTIHRPLVISDIHYLFSCRVFQDFTPYTYQMLKNVGLEKYNVRDIILKTHGVIPYDNYWIRFEGEDELDYETVKNQFDSMMETPLAPAEPVSAPEAEQPAISPNLSEILSQHTIDISGLVGQSEQPSTPQDAENMLRTAIAFSHPEEAEQELVNNKMSEDEITALLMSAGIETPVMTDEQIDEVFAVNSATEESGGGMMSQEAIEAMLASNTVSDALESGGGKMSQDAIEALLAANSAPAPEPEPAPAEPSGGKMSQDAIEALLAANSAPAPESEPAPAEPSGGKMSQDAIEALLAANSAPAPEPEPAPAEPSGGKMSQDAIEALLAANAAAAEAPAPEPELAPAEPSGGKMSQDAIEALLAANAAAAEPAPEPEPAPAAPSGGKMSQDAIEALLAANAAAAEPAPEPEPAPAEPSGGKMSQDAIEALLAANAAAAEAPAPEPEPAPAEPSGGKMSQDAIEALLNSMQDEANK